MTEHNSSNLIGEDQASVQKSQIMQRDKTYNQLQWNPVNKTTNGPK